MQRNTQITQLAVRIETLVRKAYSLNTHDYNKHKNDRIFNDDLNTSIKENSYKKKSISSFLNSRTRLRFSKISR